MPIAVESIRPRTARLRTARGLQHAGKGDDALFSLRGKLIAHGTTRKAAGRIGCVDDAAAEAFSSR